MNPSSASGPASGAPEPAPRGEAPFGNAPDANVVLIGLRGAGKSTLGLQLAERLGLLFVDTDEMLAERAGRSADAVLSEDGEAAFRVLEDEVLEDVARRRGCVIATGGGAPLLSHFGEVAATGLVVYLEAPLAVLLERARTRPRPPLTDLPLEDEFAQLLHERDAIYRRSSQITIEAHASEPILALERAVRARLGIEGGTCKDGAG